MKHKNYAMENIFDYIAWIYRNAEKAVKLVQADNVTELPVMGSRLRKRGLP